MVSAAVCWSVIAAVVFGLQQARERFSPQPAYDLPVLFYRVALAVRALVRR
jgi:hypothetical protein